MMFSDGIFWDSGLQPQKADDVMSHPGVMAVRRSFEAKFSGYDLDRADRSLAARLQAEEDKAKRFLKLRLKTQKPQIGLIPRQS
ncbi:hypothetical protein ACDH60_25865 [Pseudomonas ficuserectae]|uniref:hypothetical protein n=1 Tax=Pseudomonas syringae group genomosp. 2 TaxID=251698 RepID=UPI00105692BF|nr:hypothetical protein [Pseudomonas amygdali]WIO61741.1 hypothetical protein QO021_30655 [Pseudomonas amygdali pv. lachrymans]